MFSSLLHTVNVKMGKAYSLQTKNCIDFSEHMQNYLAANLLMLPHAALVMEETVVYVNGVFWNDFKGLRCYCSISAPNSTQTTLSTLKSSSLSF